MSTGEEKPLVGLGWSITEHEFQRLALGGSTPVMCELQPYTELAPTSVWPLVGQTFFIDSEGFGLETAAMLMGYRDVVEFSSAVETHLVRGME